VTLPVASFLAEAMNLSPEVATIACVGVIETAAEKLVSLTRRTAMDLAGASRRYRQGDPARLHPGDGRLRSGIAKRLLVQGGRRTWHAGEDYHRREWRQQRSDRGLGSTRTLQIAARGKLDTSLMHTQIGHDMQSGETAQTAAFRELIREGIPNSPSVFRSLGRHRNRH
jgi:hypothetical protein